MTMDAFISYSSEFRIVSGVRLRLSAAIEAQHMSSYRLGLMLKIGERSSKPLPRDIATPTLEETAIVVSGVYCKYCGVDQVRYLPA